VTFEQYYQNNVTYISRVDPRLSAILDIVEGLSPSSVLDIGCGRGFLLDRLVDRGLSGLVGVDVFEEVEGAGWAYRAGDVTVRLPASDASFDVVIAGEIIEHVPNPDLLLREIRRVLVPGGALVISTPNLVSWANRVLVPLGIQPLGTETSSEVALGRRLRVLGQGNQVQGHLKVFTHRALREILERYGFTVVARQGVPAFFPAPFDRLDRLFARSVALSSGLLFVARAPDRPWPEPAPGRRHDSLGNHEAHP
jgi:SAM-dependent methyltransferase